MVICMMSLSDSLFFFFFFNDTATTEIYTLSPTRRSSDLGFAGGGRCTHVGFILSAVVRATTRLPDCGGRAREAPVGEADRKSTRLNSSHANISYAVFCLKKKK